MGYDFFFLVVEEFFLRNFACHLCHPVFPPLPVLPLLVLGGLLGDKGDAFLSQQRGLFLLNALGVDHEGNHYVRVVVLGRVAEVLAEIRQHRIFLFDQKCVYYKGSKVRIGLHFCSVEPEVFSELLNQILLRLNLLFEYLKHVFGDHQRVQVSFTSSEVKGIHLLSYADILCEFHYVFQLEFGIAFHREKGRLRQYAL
jgi:hypothetical protein